MTRGDLRHNQLAAFDDGHAHKHDAAARTIIALPSARVELESHDHDQVATVSASIAINDTCTIPFEKLVLAMQDIAWQVERVGGIVGHVKAMAQNNGAVVRASITAPNLPPSGQYARDYALSREACVQVAVIALLVNHGELREIVASAFRENLSSFVSQKA